MNDKPSPQVIMVEASAGSGKTYALAGHYLKLILNENTRTSVIRDILAITFTKQAAREMKERIFEFLKRIVFDDFKDDTERKEFFANILPETPVNMPEIKKRAVSAIEYIIRNYNYFQVQTIDSFMNMLLAGCSFLVGLSAQFRIKERHREYLGYSLDKIIDNALKDASLRRVFDLFLKQYLFVENKTQWLPKKSILDVLDSMLYHLSVYGKNYTRYGIESSWIFKQRSDILSMLNTMRSGMPEGTKANLVNALDKLLDEDSEYLNLKIFADSKTLQSPEYPAKKGTVLPETLKSLWTDYRQSLERLATEESLSIFNCYAELFEKASVVFEEYAAKEDTVFLSELNSRARGLIKDSGITAPELYLRLAGVYKHFLVDEFQDTSVLRWENLSDMVRNALSAGGSLFCVGDKKQAIFRFSGGDVSLGKKISGELSEFSPQARGLKDNYRSHKHIVEFNNNLFSQENISVFLESLKPEKESDFKYLADYDARYILDVFSNVKQDHLPEKDWGHVSIKELAYNVKEDKNEKLKIEIAEKALELSKRHPRGEIAFLCRTNSEVELVSGWLVESGFSVESEKTLDIRNNFVVREIISFLKFLNSPIDNLSFAAFILGDVFSSRADCGREKVRNFVFTARLAHKKYERYYIYREFRERFESLWEEYIEEFFKSANFLGVYELAASVIDKFDILRSFPEKQGFIMHLLELIKLKEDEYKTLGEFLEYFDSSEDDEKSFYLNPSAHNSIKVLTIHRSKGLSFDAVVVPFVEISVSDLSASGKRGKSQYALLHNENNMSLIKLDRKYAVLSEHIQKVYMSEYRKAVVDELCALYVAFTRPRV
ncbi:MAG TPA: hypothetical protein ENN55_05005, partial [Firmicutes bacterium]|nr:hypothetical protein [Bacillota bacterium]